MPALPGSRTGAQPVVRLDDHGELSALYRDLKRLGGRELTSEFARALHKAAEPAADYERALWAGISSRVPASVRVKVSPGSARQVVRIFAGGTRHTLHTKVLEGYASGRPYRHPVFARTRHGRFDLEASQSGRRDWTWVPQVPPAQIVPKVVAHEAEAVAERVADVLEAFIARVGEFR